MNNEKIKHHIESLKEKHRKVNAQVDIMESTGSFDDADLQYFKKKRLELKDEIALNEAKLANNL